MDAFNEKIIKSEGFSLATVFKYNISSSSIGELSKIMPIAFHYSEIGKKISHFQKLKHITLQNLALYFILKRKYFSTFQLLEHFMHYILMRSILIKLQNNAC